MSKKPRAKKRRRGPTRDEQAAARARAADKFNQLMSRANNRPRGPRIVPPTEGQEIKPYEGDVDSGEGQDG